MYANSAKENLHITSPSTEKNTQTLLLYGMHKDMARAMSIRHRSVWGT